MKRVGNIYENIYSFDKLYEAYLKARKGKRYRDEVLKFTYNLEENLIQLQNELIYGTYKVGRYREFYVTEPKRRLVMALPFRDRVVQWAIYQEVFPVFEKTFIEHSYACRKGKGTHAAANKLQYWLRLVNKKPGKWYYLKLDIRKYFYSVDHKILLEIISKKIKDKRVMDLLQLIIKSEDTAFGLPQGATLDSTERLAYTGMPIGNLTSQMFANVYLNELDQYVKNTLKQHYYIRYMDDVIILSNNKSELQETRRLIELFLRDSLGLYLNEKTTVRPISLGVHFVGRQIWPTHSKIRKSTSLKMRRRLKYLANRYAAGCIGLRSFKASLASYLGITKHCNCRLLEMSILKDTVLLKHYEKGG